MQEQKLPILAPDDPASLDPALDRVVTELRRMAHEALVHHAVAVGAYLIDTFFEGSIHAFYQRGRSAGTSFAALLARRGEELAGIGLHANTLRNYIRAFDVWEHLPPVSRAALTPTAFYHLARVRNPIERNRLALEAAQGAWSVREIARAVDEVRAIEAPRRAPNASRKSAAQGAAREVIRGARWLESRHEVLQALTPKSRANLRAEIAQAAARLQALAEALGEG